MASAQLMEEELQQSVMVSEEDAEYDEDEVNGDVGEHNQASFELNSKIDLGATPDQGNAEDEELETNEDGDEEGLEDAEGEEDDIDGDAVSDEDGDNDEDANFEEDAEGEDDDEVTIIPVTGKGIPSIEGDESSAGGENDDEGVGAVKIKPGETDEEEESDSESEVSEVVSDAESDEAEEWEAAAENEDEDDEDEAAPSNTCMFCKQDEDNDPSEEFETYLTCSGCGENGIETWKCLDCAASSSDGGSVLDDTEVNGVVDADETPAARRATAPKLARDLLPSQRGAPKPDSHSVFNQLVLDEDPMDGSRVLRKRKTSSAEADEHVMSLRKRRRSTGDEVSNDGAASAEEAVRPRSARSLRLKISTNAPATIVKKSRTSLVMRLRVNPSELKQILSKPPAGLKKRTTASRPSRPSTSRSAVHVGNATTATAPFVSTSYSQPFYSFFDKDMDELKGKPYGGILNDAEADTSKTLPTNDDRRRFDEAKQKAEEEWRQRLLSMQAELDVPVKKSKKAAGPASQIECIEFGGWEIDTWYAAPYPEEYSRNRVLYICEFCLKYMNSDYVAWRHKLKCPAKHPPGDEIYRHGSVSVFEVDGRKNPVYCQNLCLLAKLFLGSKTLYYDVEPFLFYVLCEFDDLGYHFVGYFSKEKRASSQNNVSCILTLPIHQRKGYGNLLIDFSYLLTRVEQKTGSPEKPLSDMGLVSYRNYWRLIMCRYLLEHVPENKAESKGLSIKDISDDTGLTADDVISALEGLRCLVRDPQTELYAFRVDLEYCKQYVAKWESKNYVTLDPNALTWTPYVMGRSNATNFELGPAMHAIAPREEDEEQKAVEAVAESLVNGNTTIVKTETNGDVAVPAIEADSIVIESTEPNETGDEPALENGVEPLKNGASVEGQAADHTQTGSVSDDDDWVSAYKDIPPTRFAVYPPLSSSRRVDRPRPSVARPALSRTASAPRPKARRSTGSARRLTVSKPKSSGSRRKTGGTGRGPGRWPKGTKKSDYGNADSGPGLPPGWVAERNRLAVSSGPKKTDNGDEELDEDTVQVKAVNHHGSALTNGNSKGKGSASSKQESDEDSDGDGDGDVDMEDADAEGEDDDE
ncbi:putative histone acetyltransferase protein [Phaeoacremonium minimum UCRPA7]|uniref:Histone acetyltransferase n=1 Tax=Phaeoacremonium minimum (strain UCR-PA7) TaxID=1286976 RepID=R8BR24_PHAM7|nr:putative histone acetyltransferase protein [Phaeoacremonium minimum UCRPA7]EOO01784.1 putative histone acetyltransferase protein [Phaeoacremonium minimum UCRPA7]